MDEALKLGEPWSALAVSPLGYASEPAAPIEHKPVPELFEIID